MIINLITKSNQILFFCLSAINLVWWPFGYVRRIFKLKSTYFFVLMNCLLATDIFIKFIILSLLLYLHFYSTFLYFFFYLSCRYAHIELLYVYLSILFHDRVIPTLPINTISKPKPRHSSTCSYLSSFSHPTLPYSFKNHVHKKLNKNIIYIHTQQYQNLTYN